MSNVYEQRLRGLLPADGVAPSPEPLPKIDVRLPDGDNRNVKVWWTERTPEGWRISIQITDGVPEAPAPDLMRRAADAAREAARFHVCEVRDRYEALARELTHGVPAVPATRPLTSEELAGCCGGCRTNSAIETWMQRAIVKFCEVNGIALTDGVEGRKP